MKRILIATDFSKDATRAMEYGIALARLFDAEIELHTVYSPSTLALGDRELALSAEYLEQAQHGMREHLEELADRMRGEGMAVKHSLGTGSPATAISERAEATGADLLVLGAHGSHGFDHTFLGSVAERTARTASCPVLTASTDVPPPSEIGKILVATDFSVDAAAALAWAEQLAARSGASLLLVHSVVPPFGVGEEELYVEDEYTSRQIDDSRSRLGEIAAGVDAPVETFVGRRYPETDALAQAAERGADMIVVGTRGRRGLPSIVLGSVTVRIMRGAHVPVVSVKSG